jgi:multidrug transporter EmrE-like cation transporter
VSHVTGQQPEAARMRGRRDLSGWAQGLCNVALQSALEQNKNVGRLTPCPAVCVWITPPLLRSTLRGEGRLVVSAIAAFSACRPAARTMQSKTGYAVWSGVLLLVLLLAAAGVA